MTIVRRRKWAGRKRTWRRLGVLTIAWMVVGLFAAVVVVAALSWALGGHDGFLGVDRGCENNAFGCNAAVEFFGTAAAVALAVVYFTSWRMGRVTRHHLKNARSEPWRLVPTATKVDRVVGRDGICEIIEKDLADPAKYRPQAIVAGVGDGKTAVLVRLTSLLYDRGAVPVPVRLRDAQTELDFLDLAKKRFLANVEPRLLSQDEGDKIWRELCGRRLVVVLADGLEEALPDAGTLARETAVRLAIESAHDAGVPVVIASRPDPVLDAIDVAIIRLEPLPAQPVIEYIRKRNEDGPEGEAADAAMSAMPEARIKELVLTAGITERPLYLKLARELYRGGRLVSVPVGVSRLAARFELLRTWRKSLLDVPQQNGMRISKADRELALFGAEQMACVAMKENRLEVDFEAFAKSRYSEIGHEDLTRAKGLAGLAERLDLVEVIPSGVRFRHGIMQAYLGACRLPRLIRDRGVADDDGGTQPRRYLDDGTLEEPGRELLMALVMCCLMDGEGALARDLRDQLRGAAERSDSHTAFELLAAAYEIDTVAPDGAGDTLQRATRTVWSGAKSRARGLETTEAKLRAILPMSEARAYGCLWDVCQAEDTYAVRFQAAQALANGGEAALEVIREEVSTAPTSAARVLTYRAGQPPGPDWRELRKHSVLAWTTPLLAATCEEGSAEVHKAISAYVNLAKCGKPGRPRLHLGVEAALAQGFKWEANRLPERIPSAKRTLLIDRALELLDASQWWYTEVALLQTLALWALDTASPRRADIRSQLSTYLRSKHPFVKQVASLCNGALAEDAKHAVRSLGRRRPPSRFIWIDEVGIANKVGSREVPPDKPPPGSRQGGLHIPPAAGWHALAPQAQQLVADILLFLNMLEGPAGTANPTDSERNKRVADREQQRIRVHSFRDGLPRCVTCVEDRDRLRAGSPCIQDEGGAPRHLSCPERCGFKLCPYAPKADPPFRGELPETFCRQQERLLRDRKLPAWVTVPSFLAIPRKRQARRHLACFWTRMEERGED